MPNNTEADWLNRAIYDAKNSLASGLDSGWTEVYMPQLEEAIRQHITQAEAAAELRGRIDELTNADVGGYYNAKVVHVKEDGNFQGRVERLAELRQQQKESN